MNLELFERREAVERFERLEGLKLSAAVERLERASVLNSAAIERLERLELLEQLELHRSVGPFETERSGGTTGTAPRAEERS